MSAWGNDMSVYVLRENSTHRGSQKARKPKLEEHNEVLA